jgi:ribosome biogenesis GTPase
MMQRTAARISRAAVLGRSTDLSLETGRIQKAIAGFYYCASGARVFECRARGLFRNENITPLVGDLVRFEAEEDGSGFITEILPRRNELLRPPLANLDQLVLVVSTRDPAPNLLVIDKLITVCEHKGIEPILIVTKTDLKTADSFCEVYRRAGFSVTPLSNVTTEDFGPVRELLRGKVSAFVGNTGAGKSSLLNRIDPRLGLETGQTSRKLGRGRHTTRHVELFYLPELDAFAADTPGFGTLEIARYEVIRKEQLQYCFREFEPYLEKCRFTGCSHTAEKGCAVLEALHRGEIAASRHASYCALYEDAKKIREWELEKEK